MMVRFIITAWTTFTFTFLILIHIERWGKTIFGSSGYLFISGFFFFYKNHVCNIVMQYSNASKTIVADMTSWDGIKQPKKRLHIMSKLGCNMAHYIP